MAWRLGLYGGVYWTAGDRVVSVTGTRKLDILLALAEVHGSVVSVSSMIDRFWPIAPASGANAVQRHISALRSDLRSIGARDAHELIEHVADGYRLSPSVVTDLSSPREATWWLEPIAGASWQTNNSLRLALTTQSLRELGAWAGEGQDRGDAERRTAQVASFAGVDETASVLLDIADSMSFGEAGPIAGAVSSLGPSLASELERRMRTFLPYRGAASAADPTETREVLRQIIGLWVSDDVASSLDLLDSGTGLDSDHRRRLYRALVWQSPKDPGSRQLLTQLVQLSVVDEPQTRRTWLTIDGNTLNLMPDGAAISHAELDAAQSPELRLRSLRAEFLRRLAWPYDDDDERLVASLAEIDLPDAEVERPRFAFLNALRLGRWVAARELLEVYRTTVEKLWFGSGDDFSSMSVASLQRALDPACRAAFSAEGPLFGSFSADPMLMDVAEAGRSLLLNDPREPLDDVRFFAAVGSVRLNAARAYTMLRNLSSGRPTVSEVELLAGDLSSMDMDKQYVFVPVAIGVAAERLGRSDLAHVAADALRPWSGQALGMWPVDLVLGMADDWIDRFASV